MKKALFLILALALVISLAACGGNSGSTNTPSNTSSSGNGVSNSTNPPASNGGNDNTPSGGDSTSTTPPTDNTPSEEILTQEQIIEKIGVTSGSTRIVLKYIGNGENPPLHGAPKCYIVAKWYNEDGTENVLGSSETWYIYDDQATFDAGYAEASKGGEYAFNDKDHLSSLYFVMKSSVFGSRGDFDTYQELVDLLESKSERNPDYSTYEIVR